MVIVICEAVPDSHCYNYGEAWAKPHRQFYGERWAKPHTSKLFLTRLNKTLSINKI